MTALGVAAAALLLVLALLTGAVTAALDSDTTSAAVCATDGTAPSVTGLDRDQIINAALIVNLAAELRLPAPLTRRAAVIAIATALQESDLRNIGHGDRDSLGLFQQRPSQGWGTAQQVTDPRYATRAFYTRLLRVPGWDRLPLTVAAQAVQRSAFPDAYAQHQARAEAIVAALTGGCAAPSALISQVIGYARAQLGKPYVWGAEGPNGFDCSGLVYAAYRHAGLAIPRTTFEQWPYGLRIPAGAEQPGDLVFFNSGPGTGPGRPGHVGLVLGGGQMIEARCTRCGPIAIARYRARPTLVGFTRPAAARRGLGHLPAVAWAVTGSRWAVSA